MKNYYFTFGSNHITNDGEVLVDSWVRVVADSYNEARRIFVEQFTSNRMATPESWAFQYEAEKFEPAYFPNGEFFVLHSKQTT